MWTQPENDQFAEELFLAGEHVLPGTYRQMGSGRTIAVANDDILPASLDGRVACYMRINSTWGQLDQRVQTAV